MATAPQEISSAFAVDPVMLNAITSAVESCLTMCDTEATCVAVATVPTREPGIVTGMIGVHGDVSGFITVNMAEKVATSSVGGLLQDEFKELDEQVIDGVGEMTNIISGGIKNGLASTQWGFSNVTVPSVIVGQNYQIAYARGLQFLAVTFEQKESQAIMLADRMIQVSISLLRL